MVYEYNSYNKYTLKIEFSGLTKSPALLLSYDSTSKVATTSIDEINIPTEYFKTVVYNKEIKEDSPVEIFLKDYISIAASLILSFWILYSYIF